MQDKFKQEYNRIFFQHLHEVIVSNKVTLDLKKTRVEDILHTTETILLKTAEPPEVAIKVYKNFVTSLGIINHNPHPALKKKYPSLQKSHYNN